MADEQTIEAPDLVERRSIQEAMMAYLEARRREERDAKLAAERQVKEQRTAERTVRARDVKGRRLKAANEAQQRVSGHVADALGSLRAALRAASEVRFPRHAPEGRQQAHTIRDLEDALTALRRASRVPKYDSDNFEVDVDLDT